jgi:hypothetical protein
MASRISGARQKDETAKEAQEKEKIQFHESGL